MDEIGVTLKAENSSGKQEFFLNRDKGEYWFTLCGFFEGKRIQVDFDTMKKADLEDVRTMIDLFLE